MKTKIIMWLVSLLDDEYILVRRERINRLAISANQLLNSKILTLSLLCLDGSDLQSAMKIYKQWNNLE